MEKLEHLCIIGRNVKCTITLLSNLALSYKVKNTLIVWLRVSLLSIYLGEKKTSFHIQTGTLTFLVALLRIAKCLKQSKFPSSYELIDILAWPYCGILLSNTKEGTANKCMDTSCNVALRE